MRRAWLGRNAATLVAVVLLFSSCTGDLMFLDDSPLSIDSPGDLDTVTTPVVVRWTAPGFSMTGATRATRPNAGYFGVLVDVRPMPPGEDLRYFARKDTSCLATPGCPDASYLANIDVFTTNETSIVISGLEDTRPLGRRSSKDEHEITIIPLDGAGRRLGEVSRTVTVFVDREKAEPDGPIG